MIQKKPKKVKWKSCPHGSNPAFCGMCLSGSKRIKYARQGKGSESDEEVEEEQEDEQEDS